ncbi:uncharacterized protein [Temnothorax nylanderi]|uniref:uncharacterized protein isoform X1 n=1 Tax=Temnothorax nylanderi TaxID=102681 RepID=UPI003A889460
MDDGDDRSMLEELLQQKLEIEEQVKTLLIRRESQRDRSSLQEASTKRGDEPENRSGVARQSTYWCNAPGTPTTSSHNESTSREEGGKATSATSLEALRLIEEIRTLPPPRLKLTKPTKISAAEVHAENAKRNRIPNRDHPLQMSSTWKRTSRTTDDPKALVAPSVTIAPLPLTKMPSFDEVLKELGVPELLGAASEKTPLYFTDCRIISEGMLKDLVIKRAKLLVERIQSTKVDRGTQTFVTSVGKKYVAGCVNCRSREHHFKNCNLPYRPGFCRICGADGFDTDDCIYPHGIEHELALHRCPGCTTDLSLYCPECPDCNVRYGDIVDWLRLNYATWPTALVPKDHRHLINEGAEVLKRKVKAKFDDPTDHPNRVRAFLIRENALLSAPFVANRTEPTARELSVERNLLAIQAICSPRNEKSLDEIMRERPEMRDGEEIRVVVPTKYKKGM